jgi:hypothetical protein
MTVYQMKSEGGRFQHNRQGKYVATTGDNPTVEQIYQRNGIRNCCMDDDIHSGGTRYTQILIGIQCFFKVGYLTKVLQMILFPFDARNELKSKQSNNQISLKIEQGIGQGYKETDTIRLTVCSDGDQYTDSVQRIP